MEGWRDQQCKPCIKDINANIYIIQTINNATVNNDNTQELMFYMCSRVWESSHSSDLYEEDAVGLVEHSLLG